MARAAETQARDLTTGSLNRAIWYLAPAMMLETGIMNVAQLLDTYWVGRLGSAALAAVTISIPVRWVMNSLANGLGIGGMAVVARRIGANAELVQPMCSSESGIQLETVPAHTTLDTSRMRSALGLEPPEARIAIDTVLDL